MTKAPLEPTTARRAFLGALVLAVGVLLSAETAGAQALALDSCTDSKGRSVATEQRMGLGRVVATERGPAGQPVIVYDPLVLAWLTPATRLWLHAHECAHLALGHEQTETLEEERAADCWAARTLVGAGHIHPSLVSSIQGDLAGLSAEDWRSLAGPRRDVPLQACLEAAGAENRRPVARRSAKPVRP